ncbi:MAG: GNAT family N-acetyltransferase [Labilithrix sp.]|nr:GNAT family N-acetyltransferase [Labilithrix sp.]MCW5813672.1 GNAT family N-acetyltransferase [Labilithrix sp.]
MVAMLVAAFFEDPLFCWFLPEEGERRKWLGWFHHRVLNETEPLGGAYTLESAPSDGAVLVYPPRAWPPPALRVLAAWPLPPAIPSWRFFRRGLHVDRRIHASHPSEPHLYVYALGVHPKQKGKGLGGALLRHALAIADKAGTASYLETANPVNLPLYRKFGFETTSEIATHGGPPVWTMVRGPSRVA